jgi:hydrogenase-4 component F
VFAAGLAALLGLPPFSLFVSEIGLIRAGLDSGLGWAMAVVLVLLLVVFVTIAAKTSRMLFGTNSAPPAAALPVRSVVPVVAGLCLVAVVGVADWPLGELLRSASLIAGSR